MRQSPKSEGRTLLLFQERLEHLKSWKPLAEEAERLPLLPEGSLAEMTAKIDTFMARLRDLDGNWKGLQGKARGDRSELAPLEEEMEKTREEILKSIEKITAVLSKEKERALEEVDRLRKLRETALSYRFRGRKEGLRIDRRG